ARHWTFAKPSAPEFPLHKRTNMMRVVSTTGATTLRTNSSPASKPRAIATRDFLDWAATASHFDGAILGCARIVARMETALPNLILCSEQRVNFSADFFAHSD